MPAGIIQKLIALKFRYDFARSKRRIAERVSRKNVAHKIILHEILRRIFDRVNFFDNDGLLFGHFIRVKNRIGQHIGQNVDGERQMFVKKMRIIASQFFAGERIQMPSVSFQTFGNVAGFAARRAFKHHVLDKMRDAVFFRALIARAVLHPHAE